MAWHSQTMTGCEGVCETVQSMLDGTGIHHLEAQIVCLVHQELNLLSSLQDTLYVIYHDILDLVHLQHAIITDGLFLAHLQITQLWMEAMVHVPGATV